MAARSGGSGSGGSGGPAGQGIGGSLGASDGDLPVTQMRLRASGRLHSPPIALPRAQGLRRAGVARGEPPVARIGSGTVAATIRGLPRPASTLCLHGLPRSFWSAEGWARTPPAPLLQSATTADLPSGAAGAAERAQEHISMSAAALVRLARQSELAEGQKVVKVGMVPAAACREGRAARAGTSAEPLWPQLLVGLHPAPWAAQQWWAARGSCADPGRQPLLLLGAASCGPGQRSPRLTAAAEPLASGCLPRRRRMAGRSCWPARAARCTPQTRTASTWAVSERQGAVCGCAPPAAGPAAARPVIHAPTCCVPLTPCRQLVGGGH